VVSKKRPRKGKSYFAFVGAFFRNNPLSSP